MENEKSKLMIGEQLQHLLDINGFNVSKNTLIEDLGFNRSTLQKYLNDIRRPTLEDIVKLANLFNTSVDYLIGYSNFILDTWDFDFLEEFIQYSSGKIKEHFEDRQNTQVPYEDNLDTILFGFLTYMSLSRSGKSFEDLTQEEITQRKDVFREIISLLHSCITMSNQDCFDIKELRALNRNVVDHLFGDYSFANERILNDLEDNEDKSNADKVHLLKAYLNQNIERNQKALKMLDELSGI